MQALDDEGMSRSPTRVLAVVVGALVVLAAAAAVLSSTRGTTHYAAGSPEATVQAYLTAVLDGDAERAAERGARLYGLTTTWRARTETPLPPVDAPPLEQAAASMRLTLGEQRFTQAFADGQTASLEMETP